MHNSQHGSCRKCGFTYIQFGVLKSQASARVRQAILPVKYLLQQATSIINGTGGRNIDSTTEPNPNPLCARFRKLFYLNKLGYFTLLFCGKYSTTDHFDIALLNCESDTGAILYLNNAWQRAGVSPVLSNSVCRFAALPGTLKKYHMRTGKQKKTERPQMRSLKIQPQLRINRWSKTEISEIKLSGLWLKNLGFLPEQRVTITTMDKLLLIRVDETLSMP